MLGLISAYGNIIGLIQEDVACHQRWIGKETSIDVVRMFGGFIFKLGHTGKFAKLGAAIHNPAHFSMTFIMTLDENQTFFRINTAS